MNVTQEEVDYTGNLLLKYQNKNSKIRQQDSL